MRESNKKAFKMVAKLEWIFNAHWLRDKLRGEIYGFVCWRKCTKTSSFPFPLFAFLSNIKPDYRLHNIIIKQNKFRLAMRTLSVSENQERKFSLLYKTNKCVSICHKARKTCFSWDVKAAKTLQDIFLIFNVRDSSYGVIDAFRINSVRVHWAECSFSASPLC